MARPLCSLISQSWMWSILWRAQSQARQPSAAEAVPEEIIYHLANTTPWQQAFTEGGSRQHNTGSTLSNHFPPVAPISLKIQSEVFIISLWSHLLQFFPSLTPKSHIFPMEVSWTFLFPTSHQYTPVSALAIPSTCNVLPPDIYRAGSWTLFHSAQVALYQRGFLSPTNSKQHTALYSVSLVNFSF